MKIILGFICCFVFGLTLTGQGQDLLPSKVVPPPESTVSPAPTPTPLPTGALKLIPAPLPPPSGTGNVPPAPELPDLSQLDQAFKQSKAGKQTEDYRTHIEWRQLKTRTMYDPAVLAAKAAAEAATTDLEKRKRLHIYYEVFFQRMIALAPNPDMVTYLKAAQDTHTDRLAQPRVRPTPESSKKPETESTPSPTPND
jgi:hypothetical protein